jgi:hypothetical protein
MTVRERNQSIACTVAAAIFAALANVLGPWTTISELSRFAPGAHIWLVAGGMNVVFTFGSLAVILAVCAMIFERRFVANLLILLVAFAAVPLTSYVFWKVVAARQPIPEP